MKIVNFALALGLITAAAAPVVANAATYNLGGQSGFSCQDQSSNSFCLDDNHRQESPRGTSNSN